MKEAVTALQRYLPSGGGSGAATAPALVDAVPTDVQTENGAAPQGHVQASSEACISPAAPGAVAEQGDEATQAAEHPAAAMAASGVTAPAHNSVAAALPATAGAPPPANAQPCDSNAPQRAEAAGAAAAAESASAASSSGGTVSLSVVKLACSGLMLLQAQGDSPKLCKPSRSAPVAAETADSLLRLVP